MPKRTLTISLLTATVKKGSKDDLIPLDDIHGESILELFQDWVENLDKATLVNRSKEQYTSIETVQFEGRSAFVEGLNGRFGSPGVTVQVNTHNVEHTRDNDHAATIPTRTVVTAPPGATHAAFAIERQSNSGSGTGILLGFQHHLTKRFNDISFSIATFQQSDLWLNKAELLSVTAIEYARPLDPADGLNAEKGVVGQVETKFRPVKGDHSLPRRVLDWVRGRSLSPNAALSIPDAADGDVVVELELNEQTKRFSIDRESAPAFRALLNNDGEVPLTDEAFLDECRTQVADCYSRYGLSWEGSWLNRKILGAPKIEGAVLSATIS